MPPTTAVAKKSMSPDDLILKAIENNASVENLQKMLEMKERIDAANAKSAFILALAQFQSECPVIKKNSTAKIKTKTGGEFGYKYASLDHIAKQVAPFLKKNNFSYTFETQATTDSFTSIFVLRHMDGHTERTEFTVPIGKGGFVSGAQEVGIASTFSRRYAMVNGLGLTTSETDVDGKGVGEIVKQKIQTVGDKQVETLFAKENAKEVAATDVPTIPVRVSELLTALNAKPGTPKRKALIKAGFNCDEPALAKLNDAAVTIGIAYLERAVREQKGSKR